MTSIISSTNGTTVTPAIIINTPVQRTYTEELITPEVARKYLALNTGNRNPRDGRVNAYAEAMKKGQWRANGESIKFSKSGRLIDGQNRLMAAAKSGVTVTMLVVRGLDDTAQESMDIGANRKLSDTLTFRGEKNVAVLATTIRALYLWDNEPNPARRLLGGQGNTGRFTIMPFTLLEYFDANADISRFMAAKADNYRKTTRLPVSITAPLVREMYILNSADADDFFHRLEQMLPSPHNFGETDPLIQLQKQLRRHMGNTKARYVPTEVAALIVKAWNAYRAGTPITQLRWRSGGSAPEDFPTMK